MYIVVEGQDGTGKSAQSFLLADYFAQQGIEAIVVEEPNGDLPQAKILSALIKNKDYNLDPKTHVLLFSASRLELWDKLISPVLNRGGVAISARNWWSTLAYQGYGQGVKIEDIIDITHKILPKSYINPDYGFILTLSQAERNKRLSQRDDNSKKDTFESKSTDFQTIVTNAYLKIAKDLNIQTIDASPSKEVVFEKILSYLSKS